MALNSAMARLLELLRDADGELLRPVLAALSQEMGTSAEAISGFAVEELNRLRGLGVVYCTKA